MEFQIYRVFFFLLIGADILGLLVALIILLRFALKAVISHLRQRRAVRYEAMH